MFIYNIGIPKHKKKHLRPLSSGTKLFFYLCVKRFFGIRREEQSFYADFSICPPPSRAAPVAHIFVSPRPGLNLNSLTFLKPPQILRTSFRCMTSFISPGHTFLSGTLILTSVNDTSSPHARQHLRSSLHITNPCTEPKGSEP